MHRAGAAVVALGFEASTWNFARDIGRRLEIGRAIADADPTGVSARQARCLEAEKTIFVVAYFASLKLAQYN